MSYRKYIKIILFFNIHQLLQVQKKNLTSYTSGISLKKWLHKPLYLNHIQWELLLLSYIWDERRFSLLSSDLKVVDPQSQPNDEYRKKQFSEEKHTIDLEPNGEAVSNNFADLKTDLTKERNSLLCNVIPIEGNDEPSNNDVPENYQENGMQDDLTLNIQMGLNGEFSSLTSLKLADPKGWMWTPFSQIENIHLNDLKRGYLANFEPTRTYTSGSTIYKIITEEGSKLHFPLSTSNHMVSVYEDELSSMIACALAYLKDGEISSENLNDDTKSYENWSSFTSMDSDSSSLGCPSEESRFSSFDGLELLDSVASSRQVHPVISMGRVANKPKYSVACLFSKDFLNLRGQCGLTELDYISSLSRCKHWDAKGGKSKSFFAKTLDDRFIIKEIKKTEFCSFLGFASQYFGHITQCFKQGNQTCLAKILGIYQVCSFLIISWFLYFLEVVILTRLLLNG